MRAVHAAKVILLSALLPVFAAAASAAPAERLMVSVPIADGQTRIDARRDALLELQREAAAAAGTHIEARAELRDDGLREAITEVVTATVTLDAIEETLGVEEGRVLLTVSALATVDAESVERRLAALRTDNQLRRQLLELAEENAALELALARAREGRGASMDDELARQARVRAARSRLDQGRDRVRALVISLSPAVEEAIRAEDEAQRALALAEADLETGFFEPVQRMPIDATIHDLRRSVDGKDWIGELRVRVELPASAAAALCRHLWCEAQAPGASVYDVRLGRHQTPSTLLPEHRLAHWTGLARLAGADRLMLVVRIGNTLTATPILLPQRHPAFDPRGAPLPSLDERIAAFAHWNPRPEACRADAVRQPGGLTPFLASGTVSRRDHAAFRERQAQAAEQRCRAADAERLLRMERENAPRIATLVTAADYRSPFRIPSQSGEAPRLSVEVERLPSPCDKRHNPACDARFDAATLHWPQPPSIP